MPFEQKTPRPFTASGVAMYAPTAAGVYGISTAREWIYIGEADNIRSALMDQLSNARLAQVMPSGFVYEICEGRDRSTRQGRLIQEYEPAFNRQASRHSR